MGEHRPVAIVTGAGSGIGRAAAGMLASRGFDLVLVGRGQATLEAAARAASTTATIVAADMGEPDSPGRIVEGALRARGRIDVIVNNAGMAPSLPLASHGWAELERLYRVNAIGPARLIAEAWPTLAAQHAAGGSIARIVNVSSIATVDPFPGLTNYAASKAAVNLLTKGCANEGRECGVLAFAVAPGAVETPMLRAIFSEDLLPATATLCPEQVASVIVACAVGERDEENGSVILVPSP
ncbi:MAG: SDR family oxidoreductase [Phycisphaerales bacterium]|nr:SDR family oxidoreductase [Phycisphaerales bacterium]